MARPDGDAHKGTLANLPASLDIDRLKQCVTIRRSKKSVLEPKAARAFRTAPRTHEHMLQSKDEDKTMKTFLMASGIVLGLATTVAAQQTAPVIDVIKQASCGCCGGWVKRMEQAGYTLKVRNVSGDELYEAKEASGFVDDLWACHTASVDGYTIEGHVPAREITRLLKDRPKALGIATPGMPSGSPGMDYGDAREAYDVILVGLDKSQQVYASYPGN